MGSELVPVQDYTQLAARRIAALAPTLSAWQTARLRELLSGTAESTTPSAQFTPMSEAA